MSLAGRSFAAVNREWLTPLTAVNHARHGKAEARAGTFGAELKRRDRVETLAFQRSAPRNARLI